MTYYQDNHIKIYNKDCRDMSELNQNGFGRASIIEGFNLIKQVLTKLQFIFGNVSFRQAGMLGSLQALTQLHTKFRLFFLNSEVWEQKPDAKIGLKVAGFPRMKWLASQGGWLLYASITTKAFVKQIYNLWANLLKPNPFIKDRGRGIAYLAKFIGIPFYCDIAIAINTPSKIGFNFEPDVV